jgi:hypothetical protein
MLKRLSSFRIAIAYLLGACLLMIAFVFIPRDTVIEPLLEVKEPATTAVQITNEIGKLVMTLNAAMLAAAGALLFKEYRWVRLTPLDKTLMVFVFLAGAASYFGVYFGQVRILTMVSTGYLDPLERGLIWGIRLQYGGLLTGVFLLGFVFARALDNGGGTPTATQDRPNPSNASLDQPRVD